MDFSIHHLHCCHEFVDIAYSSTPQLLRLSSHLFDLGGRIFESNSAQSADGSNTKYFIFSLTLIPFPSTITLEILAFIWLLVVIFDPNAYSMLLPPFKVLSARDPWVSPLSIPGSIQNTSFWSKVCHYSFLPKLQESFSITAIIVKTFSDFLKVFMTTGSL